MNSFRNMTSAIAARSKTYLYGSVLSKRTTLTLLLIGGIISLHSLFNIESIQSGGAQRYILVFSGISALLWSVSELLPHRYRKAIGAIRIGVFACLATGIASLVGLFLFWWGMNFGAETGD
ncbi:hypothetical protein [Halorubrum sp. CSM-61]|uniref:hypothetical protein n=1 Tax=Halorubrum sp. CSM-61 TaxID=2485838 RepID=UPI000F4B0405|nr:hypothetical protein [Halorubrum sp. CSM-61]